MFLHTRSRQTYFPPFMMMGCREKSNVIQVRQCVHQGSISLLRPRRCLVPLRYKISVFWLMSGDMLCGKRRFSSYSEQRTRSPPRSQCDASGEPCSVGRCVCIHPLVLFCLPNLTS